MLSKTWKLISSSFKRMVCSGNSLLRLDSQENLLSEKSGDSSRDLERNVPICTGVSIETSFTTRVDIEADPLWCTGLESQRVDNQTSLHYARARDIARKSNLTVQDIEKLSPTFWSFHLHDLVTVDPATTIILTIHYNLCMGTIIPFSHERQDLRILVDKLAAFDLCGSFMLTEIGHGLDARNLETTATLQVDGTFLLHTPTNAAAKAMPPTSPKAGVPRVAVVFARLIVDGQDRGVKPFIVHLCDEHEMYPGIRSQTLPYRPGSRQLDHSITTFTNVRLDHSALLGTLEAPCHPGKDFFKQLHRVAVGGLSLSMCNVPVLRHACYTVATYSMRRYVQSPVGSIPIISFRTQSRPIIVGLAQAAVFAQYATWVIQHFMSTASDQMKHGMVTAYKAVVARDSQATLSELVDRCGWQGLYTHNGVIEYLLAMRGNSIAEGDVLVLCIKVANELLRDKYRLPVPKNAKSMLAKHESGVFAELKARMRSLMLQSKERQYERYNAEILPRCRMLVESIGQRMAYEAALDSGQVPQELLRVYENNCIVAYDSSWYVESKSITRQEMHERDTAAITAAIPLLKSVMDDGKYHKYVTAPIRGEQKWLDFQATLETYDHHSTARND